MNPIHPTITADPVTPAVTLRCAGTYLARYGWHQGDMFTDPEALTPPACALGAIRMATLGSPVVDADRLDLTALAEFDAAVAALADHVILCHGYVDPGVVDVLDGGMEQVVLEWNDEPERNVAQVLAAMHGAADDWDRTHGPAEVGPGEPEHADYPHHPGSLYDCRACEAVCFCTDSVSCVHCAIAVETADGSSTVGGVA